MKHNIHPKYYPEAKVRCACGNTFAVGATREEMRVEICSHCHPFYTGKSKLIDIAGRVEKFRTRQEAAKKKVAAKPITKKKVKIADKKVAKRKAKK